MRGTFLFAAASRTEWSERPETGKRKGHPALPPDALGLSFSKRLLGVGWDDYWTWTVTSFEQSPESVSQTW